MEIGICRICKKEYQDILNKNIDKKESLCFCSIECAFKFMKDSDSLIKTQEKEE